LFIFGKGKKSNRRSGSSKTNVKNQNKINLRLRLLSNTKLVISFKTAFEARPQLGVPKAFLRGIPVPVLERE
jgi:hypothetical protein